MPGIKKLVMKSMQQQIRSKGLEIIEEKPNNGNKEIRIAYLPISIP